MTEPILIVPMNDTHIEGIAAVEQACFAVPWSAEAFVSELGNPCARYLAAVQNGQVVGYGGMWLIIDEAHINNIAVRPDMQNRGLGRRIMRALMRLALREADITQMTLEVRVGNAPARHLYESLGFTPEGVRPRYYENGEDALIMWCRNTAEQLIAH